MKVLLAASEVAPIVKIGGLGDVIGSLPKALEKIGINTDVIVPFYPTAKTEKLEVYKALDLEIPFNGNTHTVEVHKTKLPDSNIDVFLLKNADFFTIGGANAFLNNYKETEMFSFFSRCVVEFIKAEFNTYDLIHCHDWHTGLVTDILNEELKSSRPATLFTIHNLFYQGKAEVEIVKELGFSPGMHPLIDYDIADGDLNLLFQGIVSSDYVSTVSETYAEEIKGRTFGDNMATTLQERADKLVGIVNGIDYSFFPRDYDTTSWKVGKAKHKTQLQKQLGLIESDVPIFSFVSRLDPGQKGLDILYVSLPYIFDMGGQFVLLGTGDKEWESKFQAMADDPRYKGKMSVNLQFSVDLANEIYAGSDFFFVPSRYEPCGLTQLIAMHYGTVPIVRNVGGLKDTVEEGTTGLVFGEYSSLHLNDAIKRAFGLYENKEKFGAMIEKDLSMDYSWAKSALKYKDLYEKIVNERKKVMQNG